MKVRGFQVAPAELEGHLLKRADIVDACVVPVADDYSGEVPLAFVVLHPDAAKRVESSPAEAEKLKADIAKVCFPGSSIVLAVQFQNSRKFSTLQITRSHTNDWQVASNSLTLSRRIPVESYCDVCCETWPRSYGRRIRSKRGCRGGGII